MGPLDETVALLRSSSTQDRVSGLSQLQNLLEASSSEIIKASDDLLSCFDDLLRSSNFKIGLQALKALSMIVPQVGEGVRNHFNILISAVIERLGDRKPAVREEALVAILALMDALSVGTVLDPLTRALSHRNALVRENVLRGFMATISRSGAVSVNIKAFLPPCIALLSDREGRVREVAAQALSVVYTYTGPALASHLETQGVRDRQLNPLLRSFESLELAPPSARVQLSHTGNDSNEGASASAPRTSRGSHTRVKKTRPSLERMGSSNVGLDGVEALTAKGDEMKLHVSTAPVRVSSERELEGEVHSIAATLKDIQTAPWKDRIAALRRLDGLVLGGALEYPRFVAMLGQLKLPLAAQVVDLRSAIVREACTTICFLSQCLRNAFEPLADHLVPILCKITQVAKRVIAQSGDAAVRTILRNTKINRAVPKVMQGAGSSSASLRARCAQYLLLILQVQDPQWLERHVGVIESGIAACLGDKSEEVRATARKCFVAFQRVWSGRADRMADSLGSRVLRMLEQEALQYSDHGVGDIGPPCVSAEGSSPSSSVAPSLASGAVSGGRASRSTASKRRARPSQTQVMQQKQQQPPSPASSKPLRSGRDVVKEALASAGLPPSSKPSHRTARQPRMSNGALSAGPSRVSQSSGGSADVSSAFHTSGGHHHRGGAQRVAATAASSPSSSSRSSGISRGPRRVGRMGSGATRVSRVEPAAPVRSNSNHYNDDDEDLGSPLVAIPAAAGDTPPTMALPVLSTAEDAAAIKRKRREAMRRRRSMPASASTRRQSSSSSNSGSSTQYNTHKTPGRSRPGTQRSSTLPTPLRGSPARPRATPGHKASRSSTLPSPMRSTPEGADDSQQSVRQLIQAGKDELWSNRVKAFTALADVFCRPGGHAEVQNNLSRIVGLHQVGLGDQHFKVVHAALLSLGELLRCTQCSAEILRPHLEKLLPDIFLQLALSSAKPVCRKTANSILNQMSRDFTAEQLFPSLLRVLDCQNPKVKLGALEYTAYLTPASGGYYSNLSHMRAIVGKLQPYVADDGSGKLRNISIHLFTELHALAKETLYEALNALPLQTGRKVRQALASALPGLEEAMRGAGSNGSSKPGSRTSTPTRARQPEDWRDLTSPQDQRGGRASRRSTMGGRASLSGRAPRGSGTPTQRGAAGAWLDRNLERGAVVQSARKPPQQQQQQQKLQPRRPSQQSARKAATPQEQAWQAGGQDAASLEDSGSARRFDFAKDQAPSGGRGEEWGGRRPSSNKASTPARYQQERRGPSAVQQRGKENSPAVAADEPIDADVLMRLAAASRARSNESAGWSPSSGGERYAPNDHAEEVEDLVENNYKSLDQVVAGGEGPSAETLTGLLAAWHSGDVTKQKRALHEMLELSGACPSSPKAPWHSQLDRLVLAVLELLQVAHLAVDALHVIEALLASQPQVFHNFAYAELLVLSVLQVCRLAPSVNTNDELRLVETVLTALAAVQRFDVGVEILCNAITPQQQGSMLRASVRMLGQHITHMNAKQLGQELGRIVPTLLDCLKNSNASIRKEVISCFVSMYFVDGMGEALFQDPRLSELTVVQTKLVRIYINKHKVTTLVTQAQAE